ncbi:MAG: glycosyltransferase family 2 protein [Actinomycetota bacterium]|nr:glycosyltransferase family 2 protein [Actinomycetota bacterium]
MVELSVVVPVYGCRGCLRELHRRLRAAVGGIADSFELIFVDDASPDGAWDVLAELAAAHPEVKAFGLSRNFGQDAAITAGLTMSAGRFTVVMDCDLQEAPEDIPRLVAKAQEGYDVVRTVRAARGHGRVRQLGSRLYRRLMMERDPHTEYSNMSLLSRPVVDAFVSVRDRDRELTLVLDWLGFSQATIDIHFADRPHGKSSYTVRRLVRVALDGMFFRTTMLLRLVVFGGFLVVLAGCGFALYNVAYYYLGSGQPAGYTSLMVLLLVLAGFIIVSVGVVGLYVGRIFEQVKFRPLFIVSRQAGTGAADHPELARPETLPGDEGRELELPGDRGR